MRFGGHAAAALRKSRESTFALNITSMIDMFTIILIFLLKSYASSAVDIVPTKDVRLPSSTAVEQPVEALKLLVNKNGIYVDDKQVVVLENGNLPKSALDSGDDRFIKPLYDALKAQADKSQSIAKQNEDIKFDGKLIFQADQSLPYQVLKKVMYTSSYAGYVDFKFAVIAN